MNKHNIFKLPTRIVLFEEVVVEILLPLIILIGPIVLMVLIVYCCRTTHSCPFLFPYITSLFLSVLLFFIYIKGFVRSPFYVLGGHYQPYGFKFYRNLVHRSYKKFILNNLRCPYCNGRFSGYRKVKENALWFSDFAYICGSCGREYIPDVVETDRFSIRTLWALKEVKKDVHVSIKDIYSKPARFGKGETIYVDLSIKNRSRSNVWIQIPYIITDKGKMHVCIFDRCTDDVDNVEEGSPVEIPSGTTMDLTAHTCDNEKISDPLLPNEIPVKFVYSVYHDGDPIPPPEYSLEVPKSLIKEFGCGRRDSNPGRGLGRP